MMKAYDRLEWSYLSQVLLALGFHNLFVDRIMDMVSSVRLSVLINGSLSPSFLPSRGIRQGDPISPVLFAIATEGLSALFQAAIQGNCLDSLVIE